MECDTMTREELIHRFSTDWGFGPDVTNSFSTETLRKACKSTSPYTFIKNLLFFMSEEYAKIKNLEGPKF